MLCKCAKLTLLIGHLCFGHTKQYNDRNTSAGSASEFGSDAGLQLFYLVFLLLHEPRSRAVINSSQDFCLGKGYWLHLKQVAGNASQLPGCIYVNFCILIVNCSYNSVYQQPSVIFFPCKQIGLDLICCLIKLSLAMKEHPFYLYTNSTSLLSVLSPWKCGVLKDQSNQIHGVFFLFCGFFCGFVVVCFCFWKESAVPTWLTIASR